MSAVRVPKAVHVDVCVLVFRFVGFIIHHLKDLFLAKYGGGLYSNLKSLASEYVNHLVQC